MTLSRFCGDGQPGFAGLLQKVSVRQSGLTSLVIAFYLSIGCTRNSLSELRLEFLLLPGHLVDLGQVSAPVSTCRADLASVVTSVTSIFLCLMLVARLLIATTAVVRASRRWPSAIALLPWAAVASELGTGLIVNELGA